MSTTLEQLFQFTLEGLIGENARKIGEKGSPTSFTLSSPMIGVVVDTGNFVLADNHTALTVWQSGQLGLTTPYWVVVMSNRDIYVEIANTTPNPDERMLFLARANTVAVIPSSLMGGYASNTSRLDGAVLVLNTDYGLITEVRAQNDAADLAGDATVRMVLIG